MRNLLLFELTIPTWHLVLFLSIIGCLMLMNKMKFCLLATYLFIFFWVFYLYRTDLIALAGGDRVLLASYHLFGFIIAVLILYPFISTEKSAPRPMTAGPEMSNLRKALLKRIDKMESAIKEAESKAMTEVRQSEVEKFDAEAKAVLLETQLEEKAEVLRRKEAALKELEETLNGQIQNLQQEVEQKDGLLAMQGGSDGDPSELEAKASALEAQLMDKEEALRKRESDAAQLEQSFNSKFQELENELRQKDELLATQNGGSNDNLDQLEAKASALEAQLMDKEEALRKRESDAAQLEQSFNSKFQELENELRQKDELLATQNGGSNDDLDQLEAKASTLEAQLMDREATLREREANAAQMEQSFTSEFQGLENELRQRDELLAAHNGEANGIRSELQAKTSALEAQVQEHEESLRTRESMTRELEDTLSRKIQELETELKQKEELLTHLQNDDAQRQATETELEGLRAELHERNVILHAREMEVKMIKQAIPEKVKELDKIVPKQPEKESGKSRLGSFLASIEK